MWRSGEKSDNKYDLTTQAERQLLNYRRAAESAGLPFLEAHRNTPGPCAVHPEYPLLKTWQGLFPVAADDYKVPVSADLVWGQHKEKSHTLTLKEPEKAQTWTGYEVVKLQEIKTDILM